MLLKSVDVDKFEKSFNQRNTLFTKLFFAWAIFLAYCNTLEQSRQSVLLLYIYLYISVVQCRNVHAAVAHIYSGDKAPFLCR